MKYKVWIDNATMDDGSQWMCCSNPLGFELKQMWTATCTPFISMWSIENWTLWPKFLPYKPISIHLRFHFLHVTRFRWAYSRFYSSFFFNLSNGFKIGLSNMFDSLSIFNRFPLSSRKSNGFQSIDCYHVEHFRMGARFLLNTMLRECKYSCNHGWIDCVPRFDLFSTDFSFHLNQFRPTRNSLCQQVKQIHANCSVASFVARSVFLSFFLLRFLTFKYNLKLDLISFKWHNCQRISIHSFSQYRSIVFIAQIHCLIDNFHIDLFYILKFHVYVHLIPLFMITRTWQYEVAHKFHSITYCS